MRSTWYCPNINTIDRPKANAVVSNATPRPFVTSGSEASNACGESCAMAIVMPITVPRNPSIGMAQMMIRTRA